MTTVGDNGVDGRVRRPSTAALWRLGRSSAGGLVVLTAITWLVYSTIGEGFLSSFNLFTLSQIAAGTAVIGFAQLVVLVVARMNLAVGAVGVSVVTFCGWLIGVQGINPILGIVIALLAGTAAGGLLGWIELKTRLNSFVVTLAMSSVYIGIMLLLTKGNPVGLMPAQVSKFGSSNFFTPYLSYLVIPALVIAVLLWYLYRRTTLGWQMLAVGANQTAAGLSGVRVPRVLMLSFALSGLLCGVAGVMEMARVSAALPSLGGDWLLPAFIVPVLGANSLRGGSVSIGGALVAAVFLQSINSGLVSLNVALYWQTLAQALVLLGAVIADEARRRRQRHAKVGGMLGPETTRTQEDTRAYA